MLLLGLALAPQVLDDLAPEALQTTCDLQKRH